MEQIVTNLVVNAIGHTPADGRIDISVGRDGSAAIVRVTDTGSGIAPESLPKVFDLFFQEAQRLDRPRSGLGIGLTLVQRLAQLHGGTVVAASDGVGHGATFTVRLPACAADTQPSGERAATAHPDARRIMIVEDNADARETLRLTLEFDGHEVATAADGHAALEQLRTFAADVVIIDIGLPRMDGYALGRAIRAALGNSLTLIALTGYGLPDDVRKALEAGFNDHLTKPADLNRLGALLAGTRGARPPLRAPGIAG
jgi:CheY-like chemotaxis protein